MDDKTSTIIRGYLRRWQGQVITKEMLGKMRGDIHKKTRKNKFAPFSNVKKWIKAVRKQMKAEEKERAKKAGKAAKKGRREKPSAGSKALPTRVEESLQALKEEVHAPAPPVEVELPKAPIVFDKVYLQNIQFEISGIRQMMDRISRQIDKLEKELSSHRAED